ncbi:MAG: hypothetical protein AB7H96_18090 [Vicinamibacterales bacterium]
MFQDLTTELSTTLSVVSLLFFVAVYLVVSWRTFRHGADDLDARARMALDPPDPPAATIDADQVPHRAHAAVRG